MLDFILKYWIQELFTLLVIIASIIIKRLWKTYKKGLQQESDERDDKILSKIKEMCKAVTDRIDIMEKRNDKQDENLDILKQGVLSLQKEIFLKDGRALLKTGHVITYEEYMAYTQQHAIYNGLGGNHEGDEQFKLVTQKYQSGLTNEQK